MKRFAFLAALSAVALTPTIKLPQIAEPLVMEWGAWHVVAGFTMFPTYERDLYVRHRGRFIHDCITINANDLKDNNHEAIAALVKTQEEIAEMSVRDFFKDAA